MNAITRSARQRPSPPGPAAAHRSRPAGDPRAQTVLSLQRSAGNHATAGLLQTVAAPQLARQYGPNLPPGPAGSLIGSLMRGPSTLEMVRDRLS